jgi:hypothetical protein
MTRDALVQQTVRSAPPITLEDHRRLAAKHRAAAIAFYQSGRVRLASAKKLASLSLIATPSGAVRSGGLTQAVTFGQSRAGNLTVLGGDQAEVKALLKTRGIDSVQGHGFSVVRMAQSAQARKILADAVSRLPASGGVKPQSDPAGERPGDLRGSKGMLFASRDAALTSMNVRRLAGYAPVETRAGWVLRKV